MYMGAWGETKADAFFNRNYFFFTLKNLFVIWKCFKVSQMRENANMTYQS